MSTSYVLPDIVQHLFETYLRVYHSFKDIYALPDKTDPVYAYGNLRRLEKLYPPADHGQTCPIIISVLSNEQIIQFHCVPYVGEARTPRSPTKRNSERKGTATN